jgi:hypothetical protein
MVFQNTAPARRAHDVVRIGNNFQNFESILSERDIGIRRHPRGARTPGAVTR